MTFKMMLAAVAIAAGSMMVLGTSAPAEAATVRACAKITVQGFAEKKGLAGTEKKVRVAAIASWETQARANLGLGYDSWALSSGQSLSCKRSVITVRCLAISTPCTVLKVAVKPVYKKVIVKKIYKKKRT